MSAHHWDDRAYQSSVLTLICRHSPARFEDAWMRLQQVGDGKHHRPDPFIPPSQIIDTTIQILQHDTVRSKDCWTMQQEAIEELRSAEWRLPTYSYPGVGLASGESPVPMDWSVFPYVVADDGLPFGDPTREPGNFVSVPVPRSMLAWDPNGRV